jgi:hypothetical protein
MLGARAGSSEIRPAGHSIRRPLTFHAARECAHRTTAAQRAFTARNGATASNCQLANQPMARPVSLGLTSGRFSDII